MHGKGPVFKGVYRELIAHCIFVCVAYSFSSLSILLGLSNTFLCCRYHYNVADNRLGQHVDKGIEDGLYISCVASSANLWALIMDAGTGFSSQVYELSPVFLHKVGLFFT